MEIILTLLQLFKQVFCVEMPIFLREHFNGMYRTDVYFLSKTLAELPLYVFFPILFTSICYYMVGFYPGFDRFLITCGIVTLVSNVACSFGKSLLLILLLIDTEFGCVGAGTAHCFSCTLYAIHIVVRGKESRKIRKALMNSCDCQF